MNPGIIMFTYRVYDASISEREFHSTFFKSVGKDNFISVIWIFCKSTTSWHCCCCPVMISHNAFIHTNHLEIRAVRYAEIFFGISYHIVSITGGCKLISLRWASSSVVAKGPAGWAFANVFVSRVIAEVWAPTIIHIAIDLLWNWNKV